MIYIDSSVLLAQLFAEDRRLPDAVWQQPLTSSRLLEYEVWTRLHARALGTFYNDSAKVLIGPMTLIELSPVVLARVLEPFPISVRTLDALHLATMEYLRSRGQSVELASFDRRLLAAARALGIPVF